MMTIREMADRLNMTPRAIRFYEEKALLKPRRQLNNQYRLYAEDDAWRLQTIGALRELSIPIGEIKRMMDGLDEGGADHWAAYLNVQRSCLFMRWTEMTQLLAGLDGLLDKAAGTQGLVPDDLMRLAEREKRVKSARDTWRDQWNFDALASGFDERLMTEAGYPITSSQYQGALSEIVAAIQPVQGEKGLDLGTGTGNLAGKLLLAGASMAGVDQSQEMLKRSKEKHPLLETKLGNMMAIPYFDASFDFVASSFALQHLTAEQKPLALAEITRVLRPHGRVCVGDTMFMNEQHRADCLQKWKQTSDKPRLAAAENKIWADRSALVEWFRSHGYVAFAQPLDEDLLHMVVAVKR